MLREYFPQVSIYYSKSNEKSWLLGDALVSESMKSKFSFQPVQIFRTLNIGQCLPCSSSSERQESPT